ncbi:TetR/AcrR family transcriptional regulator [Cohnella lubricantis]|uniref:TetR/AcrR family transcriptional regulator n=1 Tax=Cohnella lubricantis TaxID=2163172 RepID=UPI0028932E7A|nr:TetR/AcrR family transcriptional regulator [Cohnella lubricantis]MBP2120283.1 AcrR family transcriptional regulator [Cohnella lubricantis]
MDGKKSEDRSTSTRRRGEVLENAILQAAWDELREIGYSRLSMEGVASRAGTNKNAVYRRWPNKYALVAAVILKHLPKPSMEVPDTGSLREDLLTLLRRLTTPMQMIGAETIHGLMSDQHGKDIISSMPEALRSRTEDKLAVAIKEILNRAVQRGEVDPRRVKDRVVTLPIDLIGFELLSTHEPISVQAIEEIIDDIFLPIVLANPQ